MIECINDGSILFIRNYSENDPEEYPQMLFKANKAIESIKSNKITVDIGSIPAKKNGLKCFLTFLIASKKTNKKITVKVSKEMDSLIKYLGLHHIIKTVH